MALEDEIRTLAGRIPELQAGGGLQTEEATKQALILPFIEALGYNVRDTTEVQPESTADFGTRKGGKVDYAILSEGSPKVIFECKAASDNLSNEGHTDQLKAYFSATVARSGSARGLIGILTNGLVYKFFTDSLEKPNVMDGEPFWEIVLEDLDDDDLEQLGRLFVKGFDVAATLDAASRLKDVSMMASVLMREFNDPSEDFTRALVNLAYRGDRRVTQANSERFRQLAKLALDESVSNIMRANQRVSENPATEEQHQKTVTTAQEVEGYHIVKSLVRTVVDSNRVSYRDRAKHCGILMDNNQQRPLCLFRFNDEQRKQIVLFDENKNRTFHSINSLDDIYNHADQLRETARRYLESSTE